MSVGKKFDAGKAPVAQGGFMYFPRALMALSQCSEYGKKKYGTEYNERNFLKVEGGHGRYTDGMLRHLAGEVTDGGGIDPETGYPHIYATAWNALARLECLLTEQAKEKEEKERVRSLSEQLKLDFEERD